MAPKSERRLTVELRGRPEAPNQAPRAHNLFPARGADTQTVHGPLQRLLDGTCISNLTELSDEDPDSEADPYPGQNPIDCHCEPKVTGLDLAINIATASCHCTGSKSECEL